MNEVTVGRWDWLLLSVVIATLGGLVHWLINHLAQPRVDEPAGGTIWLRILRVLESPWVVQPLRLVYAVGIPMAALLWQGALTSRGLGLKPWPWTSQTATSAAVEADIPALSSDDAAGATAPTSLPHAWADDLGWFVLATGATVAVVSLGNRTSPRGPRPVSDHMPRRSLGLAAIDAVVYQVHWAFYREPFVITWGLGLGSWLGAVPVLVETALNLVFWERLRSEDASYARHMLARAALLVASCQLYLKTQNLWLAILMDLLVGWVLAARSVSVGVQSGDNDDSVRVHTVGVA